MIFYLCFMEFVVIRSEICLTLDLEEHSYVSSDILQFLTFPKLAIFLRLNNQTIYFEKIVRCKVMKLEGLKIN